jgi:hypothetical protein
VSCWQELWLHIRVAAIGATDPETLRKVVLAGGSARALNKEGLSGAGKRGDKVKELFGINFYQQLDRQGATAVKELYGVEFYSVIGKRGGNAGNDRISAGLGDDFLDGGTGTDEGNGAEDFDTCVNVETEINCEA